jgi:molecular chaperone DnaK (HSP70)
MEEGQTKLNISITQGEDSDIQFVNKIADQAFEMPPDRPANQPIKVTYSYDLNQRMHCRFEDENSGKTLEMDFDMSGNNQDQGREKAKQLSGCNVQ